MDLDTTGFVPTGALFLGDSCNLAISYFQGQSEDSVGCSVGPVDNNGTTQLSVFINTNYCNSTGQVFSDNAGISYAYIEVNLQGKDQIVGLALGDQRGAAFEGGRRGRPDCRVDRRKRLSHRWGCQPVSSQLLNRLP